MQESTRFAAAFNARSNSLATAFNAVFRSFLVSLLSVSSSIVAGFKAHSCGFLRSIKQRRPAPRRATAAPVRRCIMHKIGQRASRDG